jgi:uncharacterized protein
MDLILTHQNCPDGWAAAYICKMRYPEAEIMPLNHGLSPEQLEPVFAAAAGKDVIMVDYSLRTRELNDQLSAVAKSFRILDHHKSAQEVLAGAPYAIFDMKRSGAGLAWDYLFGEDSLIRFELFRDGMDTGEFIESEVYPRPWWVNYTEDQDLWNWVLPDSREINAFLMVQPRDVETWNQVSKLNEVQAKTWGTGVRAYIEYYTRSVIAEAQEGVFEFEGRNYRTAVLNIPYAGVSEAGAALVEKGYDIGLAWFERGDGITQFSLRSDRHGSVDVSAIAKFYGGGGHGTAAGFQVSVERGRAIVDRILGRGQYVTPRCS